MPPHPLTNFEIQKYCKNETRFNGVLKDGTYVITLDEHTNVGTHWIALFCKKRKKCLFR